MPSPAITMKDQEIPLRLTVVDPPADVVFAIQRGRSDLHQSTRSTGAPITFDFTVRIRSSDTTNRHTVLGPFAQGTPATRFVYVNSGTSAGDRTSCWSRRAKVPLSGITPELIAQLAQAPGTTLEARIAGTGRDGGPACASVPLLGRGWRVVRSSLDQSSEPTTHP